MGTKQSRVKKTSVQDRCELDWRKEFSALRVFIENYLVLLRVAEETLNVCSEVQSAKHFLYPSHFVFVCFDLIEVFKKLVGRDARKPDVRVAFELHMMYAAQLVTVLEIIPHFGYRFINVDWVPNPNTESQDLPIVHH